MPDRPPGPGKSPSPLPDEDGAGLGWQYDEYGPCRSVEAAGAAMPMQKIETVDMPRSEALASGQTTLGELSTTVARGLSQPARLG
jgi:hypothetical protein